MKCSKCRFDNPPGMNFCGKCGALLPVRCPKCGEENDPSREFCASCEEPLPRDSEAVPVYARRSPRDYTPPFLAEKVLKTRSTLEGERKLVTVLFADVVRFTSISEALDPEDVHEIMDGCFEILGEEIHGAGGTINQYTGDGVMALFGAPIAHEDHVRRACHAALMVQGRLEEYGKTLANRYGISFRMRIGIHAGPVVVGAIGDNLRLDYTAVGDTTNLASRLQEMATAGAILVSERVWESAKKNFVFREVGLLEVKGKMKNVRAFILDKRLEVDMSEALKEPPIGFVNREKEIAALHRAFDRILEGGPILVSVTGEPGIGKTRLLRRFQTTLETDDALFLEGHCRPFGRTIAFHPLLGMFRRYFNLSEIDSFDQAMEKISDRLEDKSLYSRLADLLRLLEGTRRREQKWSVVDRDKKRTLFQALRDLVLSVSTRRPLVVGLDDMQWVDATTREFLSFLIQSPARMPILLICLSRTEPAAWCPGTPIEIVRLKPLNKDDSSLLLSSVLGTDRLDAKISSEIVSNAGGNPLFLLEMGENLKRLELVICDADSCTLRLPLKDLKVPDTIHGVLAARLDGLGDDQKRLVQLASVIGREFSGDLLLSLTGIEDDLPASLEVLEKEGVIEKIPEGDRYLFRHNLMREVAYHSLLRRDRKRYHRAVGETVEKMLGEDLRDQAGFLAYHFYEAEDWPKALSYTLETGRLAGRSYACNEALASFERALDILSRGGLNGGRSLPVYNWKGRMHFCLGQRKEAHAAFKTMLAEAERLNDAGSMGEALFRLGWISFYLHRPNPAEAFLTQAIALARNENLEEILPKATGFLGFVYAVLGRLNEAKPLLKEAMRLSDSQNGLEGKAWSRAYLLQYYNWIGEFDKALELSQQLHDLNKEIKSAYFNIVSHFRRGLIFGALGRIEEAVRSLEHGLRQLDVGDDRFWRPRFLNTLAWACAEAGRLQEALKLNREALEQARSTGDPETIHNAQINVGENLLQMGRLDESRKVLEKTWEAVKRTGVSYTRWRYKTRLLIDLGELYARLGEREKGLGFVRRALRLSEKSGARRHQAKALLVRGRILARSRPRLAKRSLEKALRLSESMRTRLLTDRIAEVLRPLARRRRTA